MNSIHTCIENFINGNLSDATKQARRIGYWKLVDSLAEDYGKTEGEAESIAYYLKDPSRESFQAACDAQ